MAGVNRLALLLPCFLILSCACRLFAPPLVEGTRDLRVPYLPGKGLSIRTRNGGVAVLKGEGNQVRVHARIRAETKQRLDQVRIEAGRNEKGDLEISPIWPGGKRHSRESCSFEILAPGARNVRVRTSNGAIRLEGMAGEADLETSNGRIRVEDHAGPLRAETSNGRVTLKRIRGGIRARTGNGAIFLRGAGGPVKARTSNGRLEASLSPGNPGPFELVSSNGSMVIRVGKAFSGIVDLKTGNGGIRIEGEPLVRILESGKNHYRIALGDGKALSTAHTSNGHITFGLR